MRTTAGHAPQLPRDLLEASMTRARELGRNVANDDIILLGLLDLTDGITARRVLEGLGVTRDRVMAAVHVQADAPSDSKQGLSFPAAYNETLGRAQAFAASLGDGTITPEHVLLALIWDPSTMASQLLWRLGVRRESVADRLRDAGVAVPQAQIPEQSEIDVGERVWFDREETQQVVSYISRHVPRGTHWGWNYDDDRAWVMGESAVDMKALVNQALGGSPTG